jgi:hypothetical protein
MTTIVLAGRYFAADRRYTINDHPHRASTKIVAANGAFYASTGPAAWDSAWIAWDAAGADPHGILPVNRLEGYQGGLMRIKAGVVEMLDYRIPYWTSAGERCAWGSGADFALAAVHCGRSAMEAIEVAGHFDHHTGDGVDYVDLHAPEAGVRRWLFKTGCDARLLGAAIARTAAGIEPDIYAYAESTPQTIDGATTP